eukprot:6633461-Prymnesium_polylepis.1
MRPIKRAQTSPSGRKCLSRNGRHLAQQEGGSAEVLEEDMDLELKFVDHVPHRITLASCGRWPMLSPEA